MPKPIYSRIFAEDEDNLPASQIIDEGEESDDDFAAKLARRQPKRFIRKVTPRTETSPILGKKRKTLEWENLGRTNISALLDKDLERLATKASSSIKEKTQNGAPRRLSRSLQKPRKDTVLKNHQTKPKQPLSDNNKHVRSLVTPKSEKASTISDVKSNLTTPANCNNEHVGEEEPTSPILTSRIRSKGVSKRQLLVIPILSDSDNSEDELMSPVFTRKRKLPDDHANQTRNVRRKLIESVDAREEIELLNNGDGIHNRENNENVSTLNSILSDSSSDCDIIEASDHEEELPKRKLFSSKKKDLDVKIIEDTESEGTESADSTKIVIPDSPRSPATPEIPASQIIFSDEEFSNEVKPVPAPGKSKRITRYAFDEEAENAVDPTSVAALIRSESKVSISSAGSAIASQPSSSTIISPQPSAYEQVMMERLLKSAKKKKPIKGGLRTRLEKTVSLSKSLRPMNYHRISELKTKPKNAIILRVTLIQISPVSVCKISGYDIFTKKEHFLFININICSKSLKHNDIIRILRPWSIVPKQDKNMIIGVLRVDILTKSEIKELLGENFKIEKNEGLCDNDSTDKNIETPVLKKLDKTVDMRCECIVRGVGNICCKYDGAPCHSLIKFKALDRKRKATLKKQYKLRPSKSRRPAIIHRMASIHRREADSVAELVRRYGGMFITPESQSLSYSPPGILELRILQPLVHLKNFGYNKDIDIGFIAEDKIGHFVIVKLDADLTLKPGEWKQFVDGCWDELVGSIIRICGIYPLTHVPTTRSTTFLRFLSMFHRTDQTYVYTLKVYPSSYHKIVGRNLTNLQDTQLMDILDIPRPMNFRIQLRCIVVHHHEEQSGRFLVVHTQKHITPVFTKIMYARETMVPKVEECPALLSLYGVYLHANKFILDGYSACVVTQRNISFPYSNNVQIWTPDPNSLETLNEEKRDDKTNEADSSDDEATKMIKLKEELARLLDKSRKEPVEIKPEIPNYQLVRIKGEISSVCYEDCIQWLDCGECTCKEILELPDERLCNRCQASFIRNNIKLVVMISGIRVELLQSTAYKLFLPETSSIQLYEMSDNPGEGEYESRLKLYDSTLQPNMVLGKMVDILVFKMNHSKIWLQVPSS